jgi:iron complex outermembrane receptor protein
MVRLVIAVLIAGCASLALAQGANDAIVVTATRFPERRLDAPVGMTIITSEQITSDTARTLPEILSHLGGVNVRDNSGSPDLQVDLRGFGITGDQNTLVLLDGVRLNENDQSSTKLSKIPLQSIERIEILRGSGSVLYGGGAAGGTINIITKAPRKETTDGTVHLGAGSYGTAEAQASVNVAGENLGAFLFGSHFESDNYRVNNAVRQDDVTGDLRYTGATGGLALKFGTESQRLQLPGARSESQLVSDPRGTSTPGDWSARDGNFATIQGRSQLGDVEFLGDLTYHDQDSRSNFASFSFYSDTNLHNVAFSPRLRWNSAPLGMRTSLVAGIDWNQWNYGQRSAANQASISSPFATTQSTQENTAFYVQYNAQVTDAAKVTAGWRTQYVENELIQTGFSSSDQRQTLNPHAGEAALQYALSPIWTLYAKAGTSFRTATVDDNAFTATGNLLEPQTAREREVGAEYQKDGLRLRASYYDIYLHNEIYYSPLVPNSIGGVGANTNLSPTHRTGAELFGSLRPSGEVELSGNAIYQTAKFSYGTYGGVDVSGRDVPLVSDILANLRAAWQLTSRTQGIVTVTYVGGQHYDNDQENLFHEMPAYSLADVKVIHRRGNATMTLSVNNVFDKSYYSYAIVDSPTAPTTFSAYPERRRSVMATVEWLL